MIQICETFSCFKFVRLDFLMEN